MKLPKSDRTFLLAIQPYLDMEIVVAQIKSRKLNDCHFLSDADVRFAFLKWLKNHLESIECDASYFVRENSKHFDKHLDFDKLNDEFSPWDEIESNYDQNLRFEKMAIDMDPNYSSSLEDDFDGTPEEAAKAALSW